MLSGKSSIQLLLRPNGAYFEWWTHLWYGPFCSQQLATIMANCDLANCGPLCPNGHRAILYFSHYILIHIVLQTYSAYTSQAYTWLIKHWPTDKGIMSIKQLGSLELLTLPEKILGTTTPNLYTVTICRILDFSNIH